LVVGAVLGFFAGDLAFAGVGFLFGFGDFLADFGVGLVVRR
jgi:hypothetical protein